MAMWNPWRGCHRYSEGCRFCYIHKGDAKRGVDTGEIILQEKVPVLEGDTPDELAARVLAVKHRILAEGLNQVAAKIQVEKMKLETKGGQR